MKKAFDFINMKKEIVSGNFLEGERVTVSLNGEEFTRKVMYCRTDGLYINVKGFSFYEYEFDYYQEKKNEAQKEITKTEKAVQIIASDIRKTIEEDYSDWGIESWAEMLNAFGLDSADFKDEVYYILNHSDLDPLAFTDDCEILDETVPSGVTSYRSLMNKVRKCLGW